MVSKLVFFFLLAACGGSDFSEVSGGIRPRGAGGEHAGGAGGSGADGAGSQVSVGSAHGGAGGSAASSGGAGPVSSSSQGGASDGGGGSAGSVASSGGAEPCGPSSCAGCCDAAGACQDGLTDEACGLGGGACAACPDLCGWNPPNGVCTSGEGVTHRSCQEGSCELTKDGLGYTGACCDYNHHCDLATLACEVD